MVAYASPQDVADRWRPLTPAETLTAAVLADDASVRVRSLFTDIDARIAAGTLDPYVVKMVVAGMVKRAMLVGAADAEGLAATTQTAGPFGITRQYANPSANLYLTADDRALLLGAGPGVGGKRAFSIDLAPDAATPAVSW